MPNSNTSGKPKPVRRPRAKSVTTLGNAVALPKPVRKSRSKSANVVGTANVSEKPKRPKPVRAPKSLKQVKAVEKMASKVANNTVSRTMNALKKLKEAKEKQEKPKRPKPVRAPKSLKHVKAVEKMASKVATNTLSSTMNALKKIKNAKATSEKPKRPKPVRAPRKSLKHVKAVQKLAASVANSATTSAMNRLKTIRNVAQYRTQGPNPEPDYSYGLIGRRDSPEEIVENVPIVPKKKRPPPKKSRKSKASLSANQVSANQGSTQGNVSEVLEPYRPVSLNQVSLPSTFSVKNAMAEASKNVQFFKTALSARKKQSQSKAKDRKSYSKVAALLKKQGLGPKEGMNANTYTEYLREKLKGIGKTI